MIVVRQNNTKLKMAAQSLWVALATSALVGTISASAANPTRDSTVGMPTRIDQVVLPGSELEARPIEDRMAPVVLRVVATYPHGNAFRYDLEYYVLEPGHFDLRDYLRRKDASPTNDLPELPVEAKSLLPTGQVVPHQLDPHAVSGFGGYRLLMWAGGLLWFVVLLAVIFLRRRGTESADEAEESSVLIATRLRPLITSAIQGRLTPVQQAEMERLLLVYWRRRLGLMDIDSASAMTRLRDHAEAGALLRQVEAWLHQPGGAKDVDIAQVLAPYSALPDETSEEESDRIGEPLVLVGHGGSAQP